jgi:hypothetical protein
MASVRGKSLANRRIQTRTALPPIGPEITKHNVGPGPSCLLGHFYTQRERNGQLGTEMTEIGQTRETFQGKRKIQFVLLRPNCYKRTCNFICRYSSRVTASFRLLVIKLMDIRYKG